MANVRSKTTCLERVFNLITAYTGNSFQTYCKTVIVNRVDLFSSIPDAATPSVVLNDGGEEFMDAGNVEVKSPREVAKIRIHRIECYAVVKYANEQSILIGNSTDAIGVIDFSHLVELAFLSDKTLSNTYKAFNFDAWEAVDIMNADNPTVLFAVARKTTLCYRDKPEVF